MSDSEALLKATEALIRIEEHEKICAQRWGFVQRLMLLIAGKLLLALGALAWIVLIKDKI